MLREETYRTYIEILQEEMLPAMGCTEPIAIAYAASKARKVLGCLPERVKITVSSNILKNVKSVVVPNTGGLKGVRAAAAAGIAAGDSDRLLEVIASVDEAGRARIAGYLETAEFTVSTSASGYILDIQVEVFAGASSALVRIVNYHTNIVRIDKDGRNLFRKDAEAVPVAGDTRPGQAELNVKDIVEFADTVELHRVKALFERQISLNSAIAEEGLSGRWGAGIGKILLESGPDNAEIRARAYAAAGSDARMSGCDMPVVILSGSGNQGLTASLPVIQFARHWNAPEERMYRALIVAALTTIHQKSGIGRLSAYCGAVSAGCGAGAGIAYLHGDGYEGVAHTIVNAVAILSGIVCDGAKPSCAAKISAAVDAGILGWKMYRHRQEFLDGEGLVVKGVDRTISNIGRLAREGMRETDKVIIEMMLQSC